MEIQYSTLVKTRLLELDQDQVKQFCHYTFPLVYTPGTAGGPGGRDRTLALKSRKNVQKITFFSQKNKIYPPKIFFFCIYLLVMPKYWVKNYFTHGRFSEVGQKQKTEKREREKERKQVKTMAKLRMAHANTHGACKPPGPMFFSLL